MRGETAALSASKNRSGRSAAWRMPTRVETPIRRGRAALAEVERAAGLEEMPPLSRVSMARARQSRPGPVAAPAARPASGSAARMSTQPAAPSRSTAKFRQWCMP